MKKRHISLVALVVFLVVLIAFFTQSKARNRRVSSLTAVAEPQNWSDTKDIESSAIRSRYALVLNRIDMDAASRRAWSLADRGYYARACAGTATPPEVLMRITILESGADPTRVSGNQSVGRAVGIAQFVPATARFYGLHVSSKRDDRFDTEKSLHAAARFLQDLYSVYGNWDWATAAYHMGQTNATGIIRRYVGSKFIEQQGLKAVIAGAAKPGRITVTRVMLDATPDKHPSTWKKIHSLDDQSIDYFWKSRACDEIARLWRHNRSEFLRLQHAYAASNPEFPRASELRDEVAWYSGEPMWETTEELKTAYSQGTLISLPKSPLFAKQYGLQVGSIGTYAKGENQHLFGGARPETVGIAYLIAAYYQKWPKKGNKPLTVTSLVRSVEYLGKLSKGQGTKRRLVSCHCHGLSVDFGVRNIDQPALRQILWRMRYMGLIAWKFEGDHFHVTVLPKGREVGLRVWQEIAPPRTFDVAYVLRNAITVVFWIWFVVFSALLTLLCVGDKRWKRNFGRYAGRSASWPYLAVTALKSSRR